MLKPLFSLAIVVIFISCSTKTVKVDYYGQTVPDTIPQIFAPVVVSIEGRFEHGLSFSPDNKEMAFGILDKTDFSGEIYYSAKNGERWSDPALFKPLADESVYLPYFTPDGISMVYAQSKPDTNNGFTDIWMISKMSDNWSIPEKLDAPISSDTREANANMTMNGTIYFSSNRNLSGNGLADLYCSKLENGKYLRADTLRILNTSSDEESIFISPDESYILFSRYTNKGGADLFISYRNFKGNWIEAVSVDSTINSMDWDRRPFVTSDNNFLFFTRLQIGAEGLTESDIYWVSTQKLFKPFTYNPLPDTTIKVGSNLQIQLPEDYFMDINGEEISIEIIADMEWLKFDKENMVLTGIPNQMGSCNLSIRAVDASSNITEDKVVIKVIK